ncbi:ATP-binding cassette domain-containing protein [Pseudomonas protegens]|jgi:ABC-2 type transport system ATP-binding protein|uniref:2-phenylethanol ABC efflux transporter, ATP-binding protein PedB n=2 Tax=Pseudomonas protegens TaxID=380021 RepID=Q4KEL9_PSEF5|nr:ABC transporter ATP-binding protein [Pseudomonas protegens]AAY91481.1 2-phenylethanol ABC efflux transporter, ATP-binding protein PedB [Pseudomonas protegens Pf-5]ASE24273.1 ABC transporter ATP-binding protein [Pseudomonas protegens]QEZ52085.1 ATP-binding cassette domain-containing protein [Pseudomonas protegens]QEZ55851.1 ATP-binding cassette domain-containing protein [Pseudomonas protegens]QEZ63343.1 ATP-binding cassette domain-containing protein [Pseudomonas protegens]
MNALEVSQLSFAYGPRQALDQVSLSLAPGRFAALLGPNGAGKSTLIALLTRLYDLQQGDIRVGGCSLRNAARAALRQLGVVFQQSTLDLDLSVEQNLHYHAALHGLSRRQGQARIDAELARQGLSERRRDSVRALNGGHRRRVEIARALLHEPRLLLLDEASAGLDPASRLALNRHIRQLCQERRLSVLWTTHLLDEVQADDQLLILHQGRLVASGVAGTISQEQGGDLGTAFARLTQNPQPHPAPIGEPLA